ncbi:NAD-dependent epimerase/dehydratase family protein [Enterococcus casseliflavus]|uniref:NAD-dependent epimerase/dehydratase family protein n=1 Tax=Enterococcus casseliflavus TaxID=37734 RepID=UPI0032E46683
MKNINLNNSKILITGVAGFIGSFTAKRLLAKYPGIEIVGLDILNEYYDVDLKNYRLNELAKYKNFRFVKLNIASKKDLEDLFIHFNPNIVLNLAAQAGVRYSISNPDAYIESNMVGFYNILECCRNYPVEHLVYASSSSVYGNNNKVPYSVEDPVDMPISLYAATKKSNELMAHSYSKLYSIPSTGLRFFTVYGPAGRPDMAYFDFANKLSRKEKIQVFNYGNCYRDFTYIDDISEALIRILGQSPDLVTGEDGLPVPPYSIYNIGNSTPENLMTFINYLTKSLIRYKVLPKNFEIDDYIELVPMQPGDVARTYADTSTLDRDFGFKPNTRLKDGLDKFAEWYSKYYFNL